MIRCEGWRCKAARSRVVNECGSRSLLIQVRLRTTVNLDRSKRSFVRPARFFLRHLAGIRKQDLVVPSVKLHCVPVPIDGYDEANSQVMVQTHPRREAMRKVLGYFSGRFSSSQETRTQPPMSS